MTKKYESLENLKTRVERSRYFAAAIILVVASAYILRFVSSSGIHFSTEPSHWGVFGDYIGGILNPTLAYMAFYWLTQSIVLQKEELSDTRAALERSAVSQEKMEQSARLGSELSALNTILQSKNSDISNVRANIQLITEQIYSQSHVILHNGATVTQQQATQEIATLIEALKLHVNQRQTLIDRLNAAIKA